MEIGNLSESRKTEIINIHTDRVWMHLMFAMDMFPYNDYMEYSKLHKHYKSTGILL